MPGVNALSLVLNGLTLSLALGILLILLWQNPRKRINQQLAIFLVIIAIWNVGSLVLQTMILIGIDFQLMLIAIGVLELGFSGASVSLYVLVTLLSGVHSRTFRILAYSSLALLIAYYVLIIALDTTPIDTGQIVEGNYSLRTLPVGVYFVFNTVSLFVTWRYRRKIRSGFIRTGIFLFIAGQALSFVNPQIPIVAIAANVSSLGALLISLGVLRQEIILPLAEQTTQADAMHRVSLSITTQLSLNMVLDEIAKQAAGWVEADGVGIFLRNGDNLELANSYQLPYQLHRMRLAFGEGLVGKVATTQQVIALENYSRDWRDAEDLPYASETFGSVVGVPLTYGNRVIGVLLVIAGRQGRLFNSDDVRRLEMLGAQAAVAIAHSQLFAEQRDLTSQREALLISTENPVIAVDREFRLIFANPAAHRLFALHERTDTEPIHDMMPSHDFPSNIDIEDTQQGRAQIYELTRNGKVYLCHLAPLGYSQLEGWVAVMNDITDLKELDRMKSEMIRMVSHDLKNPLMGAMLYLDMAKDVSRSPELSDSLIIVEQQLDRMERIIRGVLDLEQIRNSVLKNEMCLPEGILRGVRRELYRMAEDKQIRLSERVNDQNLWFLCDPDKFERAMVNLVENAIKFTPEGGLVSIVVRQDDESVLFAVSDDGIGIPQDIQSQIFDRFYRGQQPGAEHITGSGLGLSIVKTVVESHNGTIWLESEEGQGSTFFIALPLASAPAIAD